MASAERRPRSRRIDELVKEHGWAVIEPILFAILEDKRRNADWRTVAEVLWGAAVDGQPIDVDRALALLYHRLQPEGAARDQLVHSIASKLKKVELLSDYDPRTDPGICRGLVALEKRDADLDL